MANIFISYSREDEKLVEATAAALEKHDLIVWWDRKLVSGQPFDSAIEHELQKADVTLVIWSDTSVESRWVKDEATEALKAQNYFPINISQGAVPIGFRTIHTPKIQNNHSQETSVNAIVEAVLTQVAGNSRKRLPEMPKNQRFVIQLVSLTVAGALTAIAKNYWNAAIEPFLSHYLINSFEIILLKIMFVIYMISAFGLGVLSGFFLCISLLAFLEKEFGAIGQDKQ